MRPRFLTGFTNPLKNCEKFLSIFTISLESALSKIPVSEQSRAKRATPPTGSAAPLTHRHQSPQKVFFLISGARKNFIP